MRKKLSSWWLRLKPHILTALSIGCATWVHNLLMPWSINVSSNWLPIGLSFALITLGGIRLLPGILIGSLLATLVTMTSPRELWLIVANTAGPLAGWWISRQLVHFNPDLRHTRDVLILFIPVAMGASLLSAVIGTLTLFGLGEAATQSITQRLLMGWSDGALGFAIVTPLLLVWRNTYPRKPHHNATILLPCGLTLLLFAPMTMPDWGYELLKLAVFLTTLWSAIVSEQRTIAICCLIIGLVATVGTSLGHGPFVGQHQVYDLLTQQVYVYVLALSAMLLSARQHEQWRSGDALRQSEARFKSLLNLSSDWYWEQDTQFRFTTLSNVSEGANYIGKARWEIAEIPLSSTEWQAHRHILSAHQSFRDFVVPHIQADGKTSYHSINGEPCFDEQGRFIGYRGTGRDITHHVRAEQELRRSQTLFSAIFAGSPVPLIISRLSDGRHFEANQAALEQFGYAREEIIGKSTAEMGAWPNEETRQTILARLREHRRVDAFEMKLRHRRGHWVDIFYSAQLIEFAGEPCIITTLYDVTERNRAVVLQQELEERFSKVFYASPDAIVISHLSDGTYIDANDAWSELCGYSREEIIGKTAIELDIWASTEDRIELVQRLEKGEKVRSFDFKLRRKDGQIAETVLSSDIIDLNGQRCLLCILSDITERVRADRQLRESERRFADVVDAAGEYVWEADIQWRYTYVSARAEKILGYPSDSIIGKTIYDFMPAPEAMKLAELLETHGRNAEPIRNCEYLSITHSGETIWQQVSAVPYYTDAGKIAGFRGTGLDITARKHAEQRIEELATLDTLTHLPNRRLLNDRLSQGILAAKRNRTLLGVLFIDLDRFKTINDSLGHPIGDVLLQQVARRISGLMRAGDTLSRIGGDEFVVIINGMRHAEDGGTIAKKIITALSQPFHIGGHQLNSSASIGISVYPDDATDGPGLLRNADMAMYFAKQHGRHNYQFFSAQMNVRAIEKLTLENSLRQALERNEFELFYHPKFSLNDLRITGVEALVRWHHPELGLIAPDRFIPIAEESGMIDALGAWVFHQACKQCKKWLEQGFSPGTVAVNLSVGQFNKHLISIIDSSLKQAELDPRWMELEITESLFMQNVEDNISILSQLSNMGIGLAIDDFGTGYSSLAYLRRFRLDTIKIDKSFVRDVVDNMDAAAIIAAIVALAHSLKMNVVAEGVETTEQERLLVMLGCDETQGFLHSEPLAVEQFEALFLNRRTIKTAQEMQA